MEVARKLATALVLVTGAPLAYYAWRTVGRALDWRVRPGLRRLTADAAMEQYPSVDVAERRLAYEAIPEHVTGIRVRDLATGEERLVSDPAFESRRPRLTGDGRFVAYERLLARTPRRRSVLVLADLGAGTEHVLAAGLDAVPEVALSGDGGVVLAGGITDGTRKIWIIKENVSRLLHEGTSEELRPCLSADGRVAAFLTSAGAHPARRFAPCRLDLATGTVERLTAAGAARTLSLSADGRVLAWEAAGPDGAAVHVYDAMTQRVTNLGPGLSPVVAPDGGHVVYERVDDELDLWRASLATGRRELLFRRNPYPFRATLSADGRRAYVCLGAYNPLSRTGDTDLFVLDLARLRPIAVEEAPLTWQPAALAAGLPLRTTTRERPPIPRRSLWVASYYHRPDGTRAPLAEQDGDSIADYGARLAATIARVRALTGAPRVNVVCHCMGGLVVKAALQYTRDDGTLGFAGPDGVPAHRAVNRVVFLASPLRGNSFFGVLPAMRALHVPYFRFGFRRQAFDMVRGSEFLRRLNLGARWREAPLAAVGACYKPEGRDAPPYYHSLTSDSYLFMDGGVELDASRCDGLPDSATHLADDEFALFYETDEGRFSLTGGRRLVHVPEDVRGRYVVEDKAKALTDLVLARFEPDLPILFVHGSYLFRGLSELSWLVQLRRLSGDVPGWPAAFARHDLGPDGDEPGWLLD